MGVEAADQDARLGDAELVAQVGVQDSGDPLQALGRYGVGDLAQRQVGGDQGDAQAAGGEHHHHLLGVGQFGEKFGVAGEGDAALVDHALVHRSGDHPGEGAVEAAPAGSGQGFQHVGGVRRVQLAAFHRGAQRRVPDVQAAGGRRALRPVARPGFLQVDIQAQLRGALGQQRAAGDGDQRVRLRLAGEQQAQVGADAGRLAGGQGEESGCSHGADLVGAGHFVPVGRNGMGHYSTPGTAQLKRNPALGPGFREGGTGGSQFLIST
ncbi:hypothetical protein D9M70_240070 [compost metagenome]